MLNYQRVHHQDPPDCGQLNVFQIRPCGPALLEARCPQSLRCSKAPVRLRPGTKTCWVHPSIPTGNIQQLVTETSVFHPFVMFFWGDIIFVAPMFFLNTRKKHRNSSEKLALHGTSRASPFSRPVGLPTAKSTKPLRRIAWTPRRQELKH